MKVDITKSLSEGVWSKCGGVLGGVILQVEMDVISVKMMGLNVGVF